MTGSLDRRTFLRSAAATSAAIGLATAGNPILLAAEETKAPLFKISLAEWSFHRALFDKKMDNLDFPLVAKRDYGIDCVEYVNQFFMDKAKDIGLPRGAEETLRRQRREERPDHVRQRGRSRQPGRGGADPGGREPLQVGRSGEVPRLPFDPRQRPLRRQTARRGADGVRRRRPPPALRVRSPARDERDRREPRRAVVERQMARRRDEEGRICRTAARCPTSAIFRSAPAKSTTATRASAR